MKRPPLYTAFEWTAFRSWFGALYRIEVEHPERVPAVGPVILASNHESLIDPWFLALATPRPVRYMAKSELWRYAGVRQLMDLLGTFPVERGTGDTGAVGRATALLAEGELLGIFPQGTSLPYRNRPWHRGAARLALITGTPIVPVCIVNSEKAMRPRRFKLGLPEVRIIVCEPIPVERARPTIAASKELTARIKQAIEEAREPYGPPAHVWFPDEQAA